MGAVLLAALLGGAACGSSSAAPPDVAGAACVSHRTIRQLECVDLNPDKASIELCRAKVRADLDCTRDGGFHD